MQTSRRTIARAVGVAAASGAALLMAPGAAIADHGSQSDPVANCDSRHYPPVQCDPPKGGAGADAPPLQASPSENVPPGTPVSMASTGGCAPAVPVTLGLVHMATNGIVHNLGTVQTDASGNYSAQPLLPNPLATGSYVIYGSCRASDGTTTVSTSSFTVRPAAATTSAARTGSTSGSARTTSSSSGTQRAAATGSGSELPVYWTPPSGWAASEATADAVTEAVNLRLAVMRTDLPAKAPAPAPAAVASTDLTPWYAAGGAVALAVLGAAGWRRRTAAVTGSNNEVSE